MTETCANTSYTNRHHAELARRATDAELQEETLAEWLDEAFSGNGQASDATSEFLADCFAGSGEADQLATANLATIANPNVDDASVLRAAKALRAHLIKRARAWGVRELKLDEVAA